MRRVVRRRTEHKVWSRLEPSSPVHRSRDWDTHCHPHCSVSVECRNVVANQQVGLGVDLLSVVGVAAVLLGRINSASLDGSEMLHLEIS